MHTSSLTSFCTSVNKPRAAANQNADSAQICFCRESSCGLPANQNLYQWHVCTHTHTLSLSLHYLRLQHTCFFGLLGVMEDMERELGAERLAELDDICHRRIGRCMEAATQQLKQRWSVDVPAAIVSLCRWRFIHWESQSSPNPSWQHAMGTRCGKQTHPKGFELHTIASYTIRCAQL
jgi:hypothetical protein